MRRRKHVPPAAVPEIAAVERGGDGAAAVEGISGVEVEGSGAVLMTVVVVERRVV